MREFLLASTSPSRKALLDGLGVPYRAEPPGVDEAVAAHWSPDEAVRQLSARKARAVQARHPSAWVLGSDQFVVVDGQVLSKPAHREAARQQLLALNGRTHALYTGVCLVGPSGHLTEAVEVARLTFFAVAPEELERYLDTGEWEGCAGSYRVEGAGQALLASLEGDRTNVQGLPMMSVVRLLRQAGFTFFEPR
ncbi:Maf family protein [Corallococcus sp. M34]|uniref:Maf family protein n=1 Tax=Citreicoccus inhibens TaxID=2849499 RepID=UPI001C224DE0|nr:nucleoside triphosphate pyrophosphatase [Citreicoccus inhibens]MBU8899495.1 Maf family protein [Citreicoccus inhibens]